MSERAVLSYHNALLHESDCELLRGPHWLNDTIILFYWEYLEHDVFAAEAPRLMFVGPDVAQLARLCAPVELPELLGPLQLPSRQLVLLALNDCDSVDAPGGSHWSLLAFSRRSDGTGGFLHFDSQAGANDAVARAMARRLAPLLGGCKTSAAPRRVGCGQQLNGHDCGVFVLCHAQLVASRFVRGESFDRLSVSQSDADAKRAELVQLISTLAAEQIAS